MLETAGSVLAASAVAAVGIGQSADGAALVFLWLFEALDAFLTWS